MGTKQEDTRAHETMLVLRIHTPHGPVKAGTALADVAYLCATGMWQLRELSVRSTRPLTREEATAEQADRIEYPDGDETLANTLTGMEVAP